MPWSLEYLKDRDVLVTDFIGVVSPEALRQAVRENLEKALQLGTHRFMADCSQLEGGHSIFELYEMAKLIEESAAKGGFDEALVLPKLNAAANDVLFWELTCRNRGFNVKVFKTRAEALEWLGFRKT